METLPSSNPFAFRSKFSWQKVLAWTLALGVWVLVCFFRLAAQPERFQSIDGGFYHQLSDNWLKNRPLFLNGQVNEKGKRFSPYPPGYPILLGLVKTNLGTTLPFPHLFLHAFLVWILGVACMVVGYSFWPLLGVLSIDSFLDLACYPWSEFSFIIVVAAAGLALSATRHSKKSPSIYGIFLFSLLALASFFIRYAGVFLLGFVCWVFLKWPLNMVKRRALLLSTFVFLMVCIGWFINQIVQIGFPTGGSRYPNSESNLTLAGQLFRGFFDQILPFRDFSGSSSFAFMLGFFAFSILAILGQRLLQKSSIGHGSNFSGFLPYSKVLFGLGVSYLIFIIPLRWYYYFAESFDFRLLGPGFFWLWLAFFFELKARINPYKYGMLMAVWFACALVFALPWRQFFMSQFF